MPPPRIQRRDRPVKLQPNRANTGIEAYYRRQLTKLIDEMQRSIVHWLSAAYRAAEDDVVIGEDAQRRRTPADDLDLAVKRLVKRWQARFDDVADTLANGFTTKVKQRADLGFVQAAKQAGMTVSYKSSLRMSTAYRAVVHEQVGLIKSIPAQHLAQVQTHVMQSVQRGRGLGSLAKVLEETYGVTKRRAALIARDQNNKATSVLTTVRQLELAGDEGEAIWLHSHAGKHPRPSHVAAHGKRYKLAKGMLIDGEYVFPGQEINCRCTSSLVIPGFTPPEA